MSTFSLQAHTSLGLLLQVLKWKWSGKCLAFWQKFSQTPFQKDSNRLN